MTEPTSAGWAARGQNQGVAKRAKALFALVLFIATAGLVYELADGYVDEVSTSTELSKTEPNDPCDQKKRRKKNKMLNF